MKQSSKKLYVLVNSKLDLAYQGVQAGHAVAQWLLDHPQQTWNNHTLVYLACSNLPLWVLKLKRTGFGFSTFREPDIEDEMTAIAICCDGKMFRNLKLMGS